MEVPRASGYLPTWKGQGAYFGKRFAGGCAGEERRRWLNRGASLRLTRGDGRAAFCGGFGWTGNGVVLLMVGMLVVTGLESQDGYENALP